MKNVFAAMAAVTVVAGGISFAAATPADAQQSRGTPRGSYSQTCTGAYVSQGRLFANCYDTRGRTRSTSIEVSRCGNIDISNNDGLLVCNNTRGRFEENNRNDNRPGDRDRDRDRDRPGGGWDNGRGSSITVYRDVDYRGQSLSFDREVSNLRNYGMNDAITAIRIPRNSGSWEVCTDANFRGRCEVINSDVRDLTRLRMNDTISSMRPVRGNGNYRPR